MGFGAWDKFGPKGTAPTSLFFREALSTGAPAGGFSKSNPPGVSRSQQRVAKTIDADDEREKKRARRVDLVGSSDAICLEMAVHNALELRKTRLNEAKTVFDMSDSVEERNEAKKAYCAIVAEPLPTRESVAAAIAARVVAPAPVAPARAADPTMDPDADAVLITGKTPPRWIRRSFQYPSRCFDRGNDGHGRVELRVNICDAATSQARLKAQIA